MKTNRFYCLDKPGLMILFFMIYFSLVVFANVAANEIIGLGEEEIKAHPCSRSLHRSDRALCEKASMHDKFRNQSKSDMNVLSQPTKIFLRKAIGNLEINASSSTDTYEAYFHIPVPFAEQIPIIVEIESPQLIDYRFIHLNPPNVIIAARMNQAPSTYLNWTAWVFVKENAYSDLPDYAPIPSPEQIPDSIRKWLEPTDCAQVSDSFIRDIAETIRDTTTNLMQLADDICDYCYEIPWQFPHSPIAFDAFYALNWGSSCTGHAHAGAALFRANGIPARSLLNVPTWYSGYLDMHWIIDYFVPDYGWVRMETSIGQNPTYAQDEIVTLACNPEDEFPLFYPSGIEGYWHTSDPVLGMWSPEWGGAHRAFNIRTIDDSTDTIEHAYSLTDSVFFYYSRYWGINLTSDQQFIFQTAFNYQLQALSSIQDGIVADYIINMEQALNWYRNVNPEQITTIFFDDFESGPNGWIHGGTMDEWELGTPVYGPARAHSGENCWGTDLDNTYENNTDCWLVSLPIDLTNQACAYLSFWVWNWVHDLNQGYVFDPLWLDITTDGEEFSPLCSHMGGVNDDPEIPDVGGWSMMALDLTKYVDHTVQIRFRFESNGYNVQYGSYVDDVHVYGREIVETSIEDNLAMPGVFTLSKNYPNPFNATTVLNYSLRQSGPVVLSIYNLLGQRVATLLEGIQQAGEHSVTWDASGFPSGVYFARLETAERSESIKMLFLK